MEEVLAGVLGVLKQCRRQKRDLRLWNDKMEEEYRRRRYL